MSRIKTGPAKLARHKKMLKRAKGFRHNRKNLFRQAKEAVIKAGTYAYRGRKKKKTDFRRLWIVRINSGLIPFNIKYSRFIKMLADKKMFFSRKVLAGLAKDYPEEFKKLVLKAIAK